MSPRRLASGLYLPFDTGLTTMDGLVSNDVGVDVATIRKFGGKFGRGVSVENGITNVQTQNDWNTLAAGWNVTNGHRPQDVINMPDNWRRFPKNDFLTSVINTEIYVNVSYVVVAGDRYTASVVFRSNGLPTTAPFLFTFFTNNGHHAVTAVLQNLGSGVWRAAATYVIEALGTTLRSIDLTTISWGTASYIELQEPVIVKHTGSWLNITEPIWTSHVWGTRAVGVLKYPGYLLPRDQGTISCWLRPNYNYQSFENNWRDIVRSVTTVANDEFRFTVGANAGASGHLQCRFWAATVNTVALDYSTPVWDPALLHHVALTWSNVETVLYYNGVRRATFTGNFTRWLQAQWINVGSNNTPTEQIDGLMDDLTILPRQLTDAQIAAVYA